MNDIYTRATKIVKQMTLREKVGQLTQHLYGFDAFFKNEQGEIVLTEDFKNYVKKFGGLGMLNNFFRADSWTKKDYKNGINLNEREKAYNILQKFVVETSRFNIPVLLEEDAPHGRTVLDSVMYPVSLNVGCSFNRDLYRKQCEMIAKESKLGGSHIPYYSVLDIAVDPRWGRCEECISEDPYLASEMAVICVKGNKDAGSMMCLKHFAGQGAYVGGHNCGYTNIGERTLREIHLKGAEKAVKEDPDFIMAAYNDIDGVPCHFNSYLNNDILRGEFGFKGVLRSDGCAIDAVTGYVDNNNFAMSAALALKSGVDCALFDEAYDHLEEAVEKGYISEEEIDVSVIRLLERKIKSGIFDNPYLKEDEASKKFIESGEGQKVSYEMATESLVLLKNNGLLPLNSNTKVLLIGENLSDVNYLIGDYSSNERHNESIKDVFMKDGSSFIEGWSFDKDIDISDEELKQKIKNYDVVVFGLGGSSVRANNNVFNNAGAIIKSSEKFMDCGEGRDLSSLSLVESQINLVKRVSKYTKHLIGVLIGGRPYLLTNIIQYFDSFIFAGYPGEYGAKAIYDTIYGKVNNFGRLSITFPKSMGQFPFVYNYPRTSNYVDIDSKPLFPFGYGLSYSEFKYSDLEVKSHSISEIKNGKEIEVTFKIKNVSNITGKCVPELYVRKFGGALLTPLKELKGFDKITLNPKEERIVRFTLGYDELKSWSINNKYELLPIELKIMVGSDSENIVLNKNIFLS